MGQAPQELSVRPNIDDAERGGAFGRYPLIEPAIRQFVSDALSGGRPAVTGQDGLHHVAVCQAITESVRLGQPVTVTL